MNVERIKQLAEVLRSRTFKGNFTMHYFFVTRELEWPTYSGDNNHCGTAACIAGHAWMMFSGFPKSYFDMYQAAELLGFDRNEDNFRHLFLPAFSNEVYSAITPEDAALTLEKLAKTGEVDWSHVTSRFEEDEIHG